MCPKAMFGLCVSVVDEQHLEQSLGAVSKALQLCRNVLGISSRERRALYQFLSTSHDILGILLY